MEPSPFVRASVRGSAPGAATLHHAGPLTPYLAEVIAEEVLRRGPGVRVEILVARGTDRAGVRAVRERMARLARKGVRVICRPAGNAGAAPEPDAA